ncbi:hypothetical protein PP613_23615 [Mycobacteroides abscessus]|nr:hypothetical protein [Mycobacteroides abscessus]MDM2412332.1 hypothetical protein [Mycobacteroides abscessus]
MAKAVIYLLMWLLFPKVVKYAGVTISLAYMAALVCVGIYLLVARKDHRRNDPQSEQEPTSPTPGEAVVHHYLHYVPWPNGFGARPPAVSSPSGHPARRAGGLDQRPSWAWPHNN